MTYNRQDKNPMEIKLCKSWVADFETITQDTKYFKENQKTGITYGFIQNMKVPYWNKSFISIKDMLDYLFTFCKTKHEVYFHNLSFDGVFILDWLGKNGYKMTNGKYVNPKEFKVFRTTGSKIYNIRVGFENEYGRNLYIDFKCSKEILSSSVKALGKNIKIEKYEEGQETEEFYNVEPMDNLEEFEKANKSYCNYCKRDVEIVKLSLIDFYTAIYDFMRSIGKEQLFDNVLRKPTIASISKELQLICAEMNGIYRDDLQLYSYEDRILCDDATQGGLTLSNVLTTNEKLDNVRGVVIDLKSAYPAAMSGKIPYGQVLYEKPKGDYCTFMKLKYTNIRPKNNHMVPLLKNWDKTNLKEGNYLLKVEGVYETHLLKEEMLALERLYDFDKKEVVLEYYFKMKDYLKTFIEKMFENKEVYKKIGFPAKSHCFKILLNSGYGVHAKRFDFGEIIPEEMDIYTNWQKRKFKYNKSNDLNKPNRHTYIPNNPIYAYDAINCEDWTGFSHKGLANYITAKTRTKIINSIADFGAKNFLYCDTDSLFLINTTPEDVAPYCGENLGDWELEKDYFDSAIVLRAKLYKLSAHGKEIKVGAAGFDKSKLDFDKILEEQKVSVENAALVALRVDGGLILVPINKCLSLMDRIIVNGKKYAEHVSLTQKDIKDIYNAIDFVKKEGIV